MTGTTAKNVAKTAINKSGNAVKTVTGSDDGKSIFFLILSFGCIYLILDVFYGNNKLKSLADSIFGINGSSETKEDTHSGLFGSSDSLLPKSDSEKSHEAYSKLSKKERDMIDDFNESLLKDKGYENLSKSQQKEIDQWKKDKAKYNPDATDGFGGAGGKH